MIGAVFSRGIIVQNKQVLAEQEIIVDLIQRNRFLVRLSQGNFLNGVRNAVYHILHGEVQVAAGLRGLLHSKHRCIMVHHMNGHQGIAFLAIRRSGSHTDVVTAIVGKVALVKGDGQGADLTIVVSGILGVGQMIVQERLILVILDQLQCAFFCDPVKPRFVAVLGGRVFVVEHNHHIAARIVLV